MKAHSQTYTTLQQIYRSKAKSDLSKVEEILKGVLEKCGDGDRVIGKEELESFVKHSGWVKVLRGKKISNNDNNNNVEQSASSLKGKISTFSSSFPPPLFSSSRLFERAPYWCGESGCYRSIIGRSFLFSTGRSIPLDSPIIPHFLPILHTSFSLPRFTPYRHGWYNRSSRMFQDRQRTALVSRLHRSRSSWIYRKLYQGIVNFSLYSLLSTLSLLVRLYHWWKWALYRCRSSNSTLPQTSALLGGLVAQETIKLVTHQYVPVVGETVVWDGITSATGRIKMWGLLMGKERGSM